MLLRVGFRRLGEKSAQRGLELGLRVVLAVARVVEVAAVDQAVNARRDQVGNVMQQLAPLGTLGELERARALGELVGIAGGERPRRGEEQQEKKTPWPAPRGSTLRMQLVSWL